MKIAAIKSVNSNKNTNNKCSIPAFGLTKNALTDRFLTPDIEEINLKELFELIKELLTVTPLGQLERVFSKDPANFEEDLVRLKNDSIIWQRPLKHDLVIISGEGMTENSKELRQKILENLTARKPLE